MDYNNLQPAGINHHMNPSTKVYPVYPTAAEHRLNHDTSSQRSRVRKNFDLLAFFEAQAFCEGFGHLHHSSGSFFLWV